MGTEQLSMNRMAYRQILSLSYSNDGSGALDFLIDCFFDFVRINFEPILPADLFFFFLGIL